MLTSPTLSIVVPAYNEAQRIVPTLHAIADYLDRQGTPYEVIVVDDGSRDRTRELIADVALARPAISLLALGANRGKGAAVRAGVLASRGDEVLFSDADLSTPIDELPRLRAALAAGADVAIGSRASADVTTVVQPWTRRVQSLVFHTAVRMLGFAAVSTLRDTQCGFKLFRRGVARALFQNLTISGFAFDVELLELAVDRFRVAEIPVAWTHATGSKVRPGIDALAMLGELVRLRAGWLRRGRPQLALTEGQRA
jgi:dolichyl-phosphate beta-glucosyltransferase